jgi:EpsI family protein
LTRGSTLLAGAVCILVAQAIASRVLHREPFLPSPPPLAELPLQMGAWSQSSEETIDSEALAMLGPDDSVVRTYQSPGGADQAELFVAYYKTQLRAKNAHDPKVCLPGAGWNPIESRLTRVSLPGSSFSFPANYYRIRKGESEQVVLYWFQTPKGVYTFEQQLRANRVWDAIRDNRTDMALVRVIVPVSAKGVESADASAAQLARVVYTQMLPYFPPTEKARS